MTYMLDTDVKLVLDSLEVCSLLAQKIWLFCIKPGPPCLAIQIAINKHCCLFESKCGHSQTAYVFQFLLIPNW